MGQIRLGLEANTKLDLVEQYKFGLGGPNKTRLGGPVRNWAWWASTKLGLVASTKLGLVGQTKLGLMGQYETGLGGPVRNWAWWARQNWAWWASTKLGLVASTKLGLVGQTKLGLMGQYETGLRGYIGLSYDDHQSEKCQEEVFVNRLLQKKQWLKMYDA